jgi:hypothetical protein
MVFGLFRVGAKKKARRRAAAGILRPYDREKIKEEWMKVEQLIEVGKPSVAKEAVIKADNLLDYALAQISSGETMGERLKNARGAFPPGIYQGLWEAHKVRNALVHDSDYDLTQLVAKGALGKYKNGFEVLVV